MSKKAPKHRLDKAERSKTDQLADRRENRELEEAKEQIAKLQKDLDEATSNESTASRKVKGGGVDAVAVKALTQDLDKQSKQHQRAITDLREATADRDALKERVYSLEKAIQSDERVKQQTSQLKEAAAKESQLTAKLASLEEEAAIYRTRVSQFERGVDGKDKDREREKERMKETAERLRKTEEKITTLEGDRTDLRGLVQGGKIKVHMLEKEKARLERTIADLKSKLAKLEATVTANQGQAKAQAAADKARHEAEQRVAERDRQIRDLKRQTGELQSQVEAARREGSSLTPDQRLVALSDAFMERDAAKKTLAAVAATLNLSSADLVQLSSAVGNSELKSLLSGRSITEVAIQLTGAVQGTAGENLQLQEQLDDLRSELAGKEKERKAAVAASLITPPQSPVLAKFNLNGTSPKVVEELAKARKETEREKERVGELEKRLAAFEAGNAGRSPSRASFRGSDSATTNSSNAAFLVTKLTKTVNGLNTQVSELREENMELLMKLAGVDI